MKSIKRLFTLLLCLALTLSVIGVVCASAAPNVEENKKTVFTLLHKAGYKSAAICGIMANIERESNFNPTATGDSGSSYGICQWRYERREALLSRKNYSSLSAQVQYLIDELNGKTYTTKWKAIGDRIKALPNTAQGAYDAAYDFCYNFEIPANRSNVAVKRGNSAKDNYWPLWKNPSTCTISVDKTKCKVGETLTIRVGSDISGSDYAVAVYCGDTKVAMLLPTSKSPDTFTYKPTKAGSYKLYASATNGAKICYTGSKNVYVTVEEAAPAPTPPTTEPTPPTTEPTTPTTNPTTPTTQPLTSGTSGDTSAKKTVVIYTLLGKYSPIYLLLQLRNSIINLINRSIYAML